MTEELGLDECSFSELLAFLSSKARKSSNPMISMQDRKRSVSFDVFDVAMVDIKSGRPRTKVTVRRVSSTE